MLSVPLDGFCLNDLASVLGATPNHIPLKYSCVIKLVREKLEKVNEKNNKNQKGQRHFPTRKQSSLLPPFDSKMKTCPCFSLPLSAVRVWIGMKEYDMTQ